MTTMVRVGMIGMALASLTACNRNHVPLTACEGGKPVVERVLDVAPPNCDAVLPGVAAEG